MEKSVKSMLISQIEDALEERQNNDRRKQRETLPEGVDDRRKGDRRAEKKAH